MFQRHITEYKVSVTRADGVLSFAPTEEHSLQIQNRLPLLVGSVMGGAAFLLVVAAIVVVVVFRRWVVDPST